MAKYGLLLSHKSVGSNGHTWRLAFCWLPFSLSLHCFKVQLNSKFGSYQADLPTTPLICVAALVGVEAVQQKPLLSVAIMAQLTKFPAIAMQRTAPSLKRINYSLWTSSKLRQRPINPMVISAVRPLHYHTKIFQATVSSSPISWASSLAPSEESKAKSAGQFGNSLKTQRLL